MSRAQLDYVPTTAPFDRDTEVDMKIDLPTSFYRSPPTAFNSNFDLNLPHDSFKLELDPKIAYQRSELKNHLNLAINVIGLERDLLGKTEIPEAVYLD